jgi:hypothetical protein
MTMPDDTSGSGTPSYNDRSNEPPKDALPKPHIEIIVDGNSIYKPGMKTYFVDEAKKGSIRSTQTTKTATTTTETYTEVICTCDLVAVPNIKSKTICACEAFCSCNSQCSCEKHCSCNSQCSCQNVCSCNNYSSGGGGSVSCGSPCACVPVH